MNTTSEMRAENAFYKDGRFTVTLSDIRTRSAYYPVSDTVGRIRNDVLYWALGYAALMGAGLYLYADLWRFDEMVAMGGSIAVALLIGASVSILQLDARGFPARLFFGRRGAMRKVFTAITEARAQSGRQGQVNGGAEVPEE